MKHVVVVSHHSDKCNSIEVYSNPLHAWVAVADLMMKTAETYLVKDDVLQCSVQNVWHLDLEEKIYNNDFVGALNIFKNYAHKDHISVELKEIQ